MGNSKSFRQNIKINNDPLDGGEQFPTFLYARHDALSRSSEEICMSDNCGIDGIGIIISSPPHVVGVALNIL